MKQHRKKYTAMLLALCAALNLTACGGSGGNSFVGRCARGLTDI